MATLRVFALSHNADGTEAARAHSCALLARMRVQCDVHVVCLAQYAASTLGSSAETAAALYGDSDIVGGSGYCDNGGNGDNGQNDRSEAARENQDHSRNSASGLTQSTQTTPSSITDTDTATATTTAEHYTNTNTNNTNHTATSHSH
eukprot:c23319_g1_i1.p2 GENE.c23319_g1_i1~~c23319_g1_i1.p2  ORF type:complete len:147 (+),score=41.96 c23319_g1_i1:428-868(+)